MTPETYYAELRRQLPAPVWPAERNETVYISSLDGLRKAFRAVEPTHLGQIRLTAPIGPDDGPRSVDTFNQMFAAIADLDASEWHLPRVTDAARERERLLLCELLRDGGASDGIDIANRWIRPAVSRLLHEMVFGSRGDVAPWDVDAFEAAYRIVAFLDGKYRSEQAMHDGIAAVSAFLDARALQSMPMHRAFLARFAMFATGHETPANVFCNVLLHGRSKIRGARIGAVLAEAARIDPPIQCLFRTAARGFCVGDEEIAAGTRLGLHIGLASRDPQAFVEPDRFDEEANSAKTSGVFFGDPDGGCPGKSIAFSIARELLTIAQDRLDALVPKRATWLTTPDVRGVACLFV